jgi:four helix bundle protein
MQRWSVGRAHRRLVVWQRAMELAMEARAFAKRLPANERFDLASQLKRAASSVPANIAEANGRHHRGDQVRFLSVARGSLMELDTHLEIAERSGYAKETDLAKARALIDNISLLLARLSRAVSPDNS